jgi:hypothetical protein
MAKPETHAAIKAKFPKLNLTKKRLDLIGDKLEPKVTTELTLDALIDSFNDLQPIEDLAKLDDQVSTAAQKLKEARITPKPAPKTEENSDDDDKDDGDIPGDAPAYVKALMASNKKLMTTVTSLSGEVTGLKTEKTANTIKSSVAAKLKDVPAIIWSRWAMPSKEEDIDAFVTDVNTEFAKYEKEQTEKGLTVVGRPPSGSGAAAAGGGKASKEEVAAVVKDIM